LGVKGLNACYIPHIRGLKMKNGKDELLLNTLVLLTGLPYYFIADARRILQVMLVTVNEA
jgi:hypothetical protein